MKLQKIYFDAYKSLLNRELEINDRCLGFVGINESGKSNLLTAISTLSPSNNLNISDIPKMGKKTFPYIRFQFIPEEIDRNRIIENIHLLTERSQKEIDSFLSSDFFIQYHVTFDYEKQSEKRFFSIENLKLPSNTFVLRSDVVTDNYFIHRNEKFISLDKIIFLSNDEIDANIKITDDSLRLFKINNEIVSLENRISELKSHKIENEASSKSEEVNDDSLKKKGNQLDSANQQAVNNQLEELQKQLDILKDEKNTLQLKLEGFNISQLIHQNNEELLKIESSLKQTNAEINDIELKLKKPQQTTSSTEIQQQNETNNIDSLKKKQEKLNNDKLEVQRYLKSLQEPLRDKFTNNPNDISKCLGLLVMKDVESFLPKVVFWKHSQDYILQGETLFEIISNAIKLEDISRPLINLFRIGLDINTLEELKITIAEIRGNPSERSRYQTKLNVNINKYLQSVWPDYDQKINITLEQERIRVEFYDPSCDDASYYNMGERSQGCQTFISFLLTVGAEAKQGVISDTVLLLDEPETHLHPSGVRFMLQELIRAAKNNNYVIFATHSIFMIDRNNYNRHIILKKEKEQTLIQPANIERIGFFMLEEVLYSTLDIDLHKDFESAKQYNFVFEGNSDAKLFQHFYDKILDQNKKSFKKNHIGFYQGGKCSDIRKYFTHKPIQLGAVWIFILDADGPANDLKEFIVNKYFDFLDKYVYVFQYSKNDSSNIPIQLEDLLPNTILTESINEVANKLNIDLNLESLNKITNLIFSESFSSILENIKEKEIFKSSFKEIFNTKVASKLKEIKNKDEMEKLFPDYFKWIFSVIDHINETQDNLTQEIKQKKSLKKNENNAISKSETKLEVETKL